jgi:uncharacterized protein (DUF433 family)
MELASPSAIQIVRDPSRCGGDPIIAGTRMPVHSVVSHVRRNEGDLQRVVDDFPYLTVEQIQAVLDWYQDHREEIDAILIRQRADYQRLLGETPASR